MRGFCRLLVTQARRDRWVLPIWIVGIAVLGLAVGAAVASQFGEEAQRAAIIVLASANPAVLFLRGLPDGLSVGAVVFFQGFAFTAVLAGLMSTFLVVRHTRADEELGRSELVGATPIGRAVPLMATLTLALLANVVLAAAVSGGYILGGLPVEGSLVAGASVGSAGLVFAGVAAILAQALPSGRGANGAAGAAVGVAYLVRGIGDALGTPSSDLTRVTPAAHSWFSPIGWGQATRAFTEPTLLPLVLSLTVAVALGGAALVIRTRRDLDASLFPERAGRSRARLGGRSVLGLAWRLQRTALIAWAIGGAVLGAIAGGLAPVVAQALADNASLSQLIARLVPGTAADTVDIFTAAILGIAGILAAAAGVQAVLRLRTEETEGRAELLLATPTGRLRWLFSTGSVAAISVLVVCIATGFATGTAIATTTGDAADLGRLTGAALAHAPAAIVIVALTAVLFGALPRATIALGWGLLVLALVLGQFGELLQLPEWLQSVSPFYWSSALPVEHLDVAAAVILVAIALAGAVGAALALRRRDLVS